MIQIEINDQVKTILDHHLDQHNGMVRDYPNSVAAVVGEWTYNDVIMWLYNEVFDERAQTLSDKDFGRLSG